MAKISTYAAGTATATDTVIGTDTDNSDATKTFTMQSIADFSQAVGMGIVTNSGADFTLAITDSNKYVRCTGTATTVTIPLNSSVAFAKSSAGSSESSKNPAITTISAAKNPAAVANAPQPNLVCHKTALFKVET